VSSRSSVSSIGKKFLESALNPLWAQPRRKRRAQ